MQLAELAMEARPLRMEPAFDIWQLGVVRLLLLTACKGLMPDSQCKPAAR